MTRPKRKHLPTRRPPDELTVGWLTMFVIGSDLFVVSPLLPLIAADYGCSAALAGLSVTSFALSYMLSAPMLGHGADRAGRERMLIWCLFAFAGANILAAMAGSLCWLIAARLCAGAATSGVSPAVYALIGGRAPPDRRATWLSIAVSGLLMSLSVGAPACLGRLWRCREPRRDAGAIEFTGGCPATRPDGGLEHRGLCHIYLSRRRAHVIWLLDRGALWRHGFLWMWGHLRRPARRPADGSARGRTDECDRAERSLLRLFPAASPARCWCARRWCLWASFFIRPALLSGSANAARTVFSKRPRERPG